MPKELHIRVRRIDDLTVVQAFEDIISQMGQGEFDSNFSIIPGVSIQLKDIKNEDLAGEYSIENASLNIRIEKGKNKMINVSFHRSILVSNQGRRPSADFNEFHVTYSPDAEDWSKDWRQNYLPIKILRKIDIPLTNEPVDGIRESVHDIVVGLGAQHRSMLENLDRLLKELNEKRVLMDTEFSKKNEDLNELFLKKEKEILEERERLNLQSHMHERRKILADVNGAVRERMKRPVGPIGARISRWVVFISLISLGCLSAAYALQSLMLSNQLTGRFASGNIDTIDWIIISRGIIASVFSIGVIIYAISWLKSFYRADVETAEEFDRFNLDMNRASWAIETYLEIRQNSLGDVPEAWMSGVTQNLFEQNTKRSRSDAVEALGALLGFTASASVGTDGAKLEFNQKGIRRMASQVSKDAKE